MHDLGSHFPNATGHPDGHDEYMPCGDILIMGLALANSLRYSDDQLSWSRWAAKGEPSPERHGEARGIFPLRRFQLRDSIDHQDPKWGGPQKGAQQAQQWVINYGNSGPCTFLGTAQST
jgi:glutaminase A-like protein